MSEALDRYEQLTAYLDGELTDAERAEVERLLEREPAARALLDDLRATVRLVGSLPRERSRFAVDQIIRPRLEAGSGPGAADETAFPSRRTMGWVRGSALAASIALACTAAYLGMVRLQEYRERRVFTMADNEMAAATRDVSMPASATPEARKGQEAQYQSSVPNRPQEPTGPLAMESTDLNQVPPNPAVSPGQAPGPAYWQETPLQRAPVALAEIHGGPAPARRDSPKPAPVYLDADDAVEADTARALAPVENLLVVTADEKTRGEIVSRVQMLLAAAEVPESVQPSTNLQPSHRPWYRRHSSSAASFGELEKAELAQTPGEAVDYSLNIEPQLARQLITSIGSGGRQRSVTWTVGERVVPGAPEAWAAVDRATVREKKAAEVVSLDASAATRTSATPLAKPGSRSRSAASRPTPAAKPAASMDRPPEQRELIRINLRIQSLSLRATTQGAGGG
jgi:anti-sigma factor RsiW